MTDPRQLARLLKEVRGKASPVQRMKVLARAWRTLQRLSPTERAALASEVGIDGAEEIVERMASKYGRMKPAVILQALEKARSASPTDLRDLFRGLRDPRRRKQIVQRGIQALASGLTEESPTPPNTSPDVASGVTQHGDPAAQSPPPAEATPEPPRKSTAKSAAVAAAAVAATAAASPKPPQPPPKPEAKPGPHAEPPAESKRPARVAEAPRAKLPPKPEPPKVYRLGPPSEPSRDSVRPHFPKPAEQRRHTPPVARREPPSIGAEELIARIEKSPRVIGRLRVVRSHARQARGLTVDELGRLLNLFESPWARRRALIALLEQRVPHGLGDALALIESLESPSGRRWCMGTILDAWSLSETERGDLHGRRRRPHETTAAII